MGLGSGVGFRLALERSRPAELTRLWEALCGRAAHLSAIARLFRHRPEHALWEHKVFHDIGAPAHGEAAAEEGSEDGFYSA